MKRWILLPLLLAATSPALAGNWFGSGPWASGAYYPGQLDGRYFANVYNNLGGLYVTLGNLTAARDYYQRQMELNRKIIKDLDELFGPYEASLMGNPIADPERPLEVLRTIHSFDPCIACAVHMLDPEGKEVVKVKAL